MKCVSWLDFQLTQSGPMVSSHNHLEKCPDINRAVFQFIWFENIRSSFLYISYRQVLSYHSDRSSYKLLVHSYSIYTLHTCK